MSTEKVLSEINFFISSTYTDLREYRDVVIKKIQSQAGVINAQEFFGSRDSKPLVTCLSEVEKSHVFILIVGHRYGSIDEETGRSFTELEYDKAKQLNIPKFVFIQDDETPIPAKNVEIGEKASKLSEFKKRLKLDHTISFFSTAEDLGNKIIQDLRNELPKMGFKLGESAEQFFSVTPLVILKKFLALPTIYYGMKIKVDCILGDYKRADEDKCEAFSFRYGATISRTFLFDDNVLQRQFSVLNEIYAEGIDAEALIELPSSKATQLTLKTVQGNVHRKDPVYQILDSRDLGYYNAWGIKEKVKVGVDQKTQLFCGLQYESSE